ncbi:MAG: winged helix-turn-helix domain-containing protein [Peptococcaceae bacterium]|nr:winged helix-turn-helix domain-containing protein [Peptococcaceae bacterium]
MNQNPAITYKELADSINRSTSTVKRHIQELKASGALFPGSEAQRAAGGE